MKKSIFIPGLLLIFIVGIAFYYFAPLTSNKVFPYWDKIDAIWFSDYFGPSEGEDQHIFYNSTVKDPDDINKIKHIFDSFKYTRSLDKSGGYSAEKVLRMDVFNKVNDGEYNNYNITIFSVGYVSIVKSNKHRLFTVNSNEAEQLIDDLVYWLYERDN